jgi:hypothetical protein
MKIDDNNRLADKWLDAVIEQYGRAEPDSGLEDRVLRRLCAVPEKRVRWQGWAVWATAAVALTALTFLMLRKPNQKSAAVMEHLPAIGLREDNASKNDTARSTAPESFPAAVSSIVGVPPRERQTSHKIATPPKLEQFPSPEPLSEQEKILIDYARNFGQEAVLVARAQTELSKREALEQKGLANNEITTESQQPGEPE